MGKQPAQAIVVGRWIDGHQRRGRGKRAEIDREKVVGHQQLVRRADLRRQVAQARDGKQWRTASSQVHHALHLVLGDQCL